MKTLLQELRIGNYIEYNGEIIKLDGSLFACYIQNELDYPFNEIPLTEEILLKFGFEDQEFSDEDGNKIYMLHHKKFYLTSDESCIFSEVFLPIYSNDCVSVKYVHQLQNLYFALTGEELTFKN